MIPARTVHPDFPPYLYDAYRATVRRAPSQGLVEVPRTLSEVTGPGPVVSASGGEDADLTTNSGTGGEAGGERIIVTGRVVDDEGRAIANTLIEVWQANAAGRYRHRHDQHHAPIDVNFIGFGRCLTDRNGVYRFTTIRPGAYPWQNHENAWRPAHIHFSLFGDAAPSRLVTQMYFPGDPLLDLDPIFNSIPTAAARDRLIARYAHDVTQPSWALGFRFDIVLRGPEATPFETPEHEHAAQAMSRLPPTPPQTVGPFFHGGMLREGMNVMASSDTLGERIRIEGQVRDGDGAPVTDAVVELWQANAQGRYRHAADRRDLPDDPTFTGFGRCGTDDDGRYWFVTILPGIVPGPGGNQARHINVAVFARGLLHHLSTRLYFEGGSGNEADPLLRRIPAERRGTMIARRSGSGVPSTYRFDIVLQGPDETVFFDL